MSLFDKIGNGVIEAGNSLSQKAKDLTEQTRINSELDKYRTQQAECFTELGKRVYEAKCRDEEPDIMELLEQIRTLDGFIHNYSENLNDKKGLVQCTGCGSEIPRNSVFCPKCGKKVEISNVVICPKCGRQLERGTKFCVGCGTKIS